MPSRNSTAFSRLPGGCQVHPHMRPKEVLGNAPAIAVHNPEVELSVSVALFGVAAILLRRLGSILRNALAEVVHVPEV